MSSSAYAYGECYVEFPPEKFADLDRDFRAFLEDRPKKAFDSEPLFSFAKSDFRNGNIIFNMDPDGELSRGEWEEFDCWLKFIVEDFFAPRKIKVYGAFDCESEGEKYRYLVTKNWKVKFQTSTLQWHRPKTWDRKFPKE